MRGDGTIVPRWGDGWTIVIDEAGLVLTSAHIVVDEAGSVLTSAHIVVDSKFPTFLQSQVWQGRCTFLERWA